MTTVLSQRLAGAAAALTLSACNVLPIYQPAPSDARITFVGLGQPGFCSAAGRFKLDVTEENGVRSALVPAGQRLTLWSYMNFQGYQAMSTCHPALSFTPASRTAYVANAGLVNGKCFIELVRDDARTATGLAIEPTAGAPTC